MKRVAIIPARGGSRRIPRKNIRLFHGRPIIEYSIETAMLSGLFGMGVYVSTEDPEIAKIAWRMKAHVHPRQKALAQDDVGTQQVAAAAVRELWPSVAAQPDLVCVIYPTAPLMCTGDLHDGLHALTDQDAPYAYAVGACGVDAGQWYWGLTSALLDEIPLEHPKVVRVRIPDARVCDINTEQDWQHALKLHQAMTGPHL